MMLDRIMINMHLPSTGFINDYSTIAMPAQGRQRRKQQNQRIPFKPPDNVNSYNVFKQMFVEVGIQELINNAENTKQKAISATNSVEKGNW